MWLNKVRSQPEKIVNFIKRHRIISVVLLVVILVIGFFLRPKPPKPVETQRVQRENVVQSLTITGTITAERTVDLAFQIGGKLTSLNVKKGSFVTQGQTIATLDQATALKNLKTALLNYSIQRNNFEQTNQGQQAAKPLDAVNINMKRLLENNQYNLDLTINSVELQELARQESILTTPISGIVTRADVKTSGVNITPTTTFTVTDPDSLSFKMEIDEADISKVEIGQPVDVELDSYPGKTIHLKVASIDFTTHTTSTGGNAYDVKATITPNSDLNLRVGMNGNASIITNRRNGVLSIPVSSLTDDNKVYIKDGTKYVKKSVTLGLQSDTEAEVIRGLSEGDQLVVDPNSVPVKK
jgi:RND family efflux transporter MFP subunit